MPLIDIPIFINIFTSLKARFIIVIGLFSLHCLHCSIIIFTLFSHHLFSLLGTTVIWASLAMGSNQFLKRRLLLLAVIHRISLLYRRRTILSLLWGVFKLYFNQPVCMKLLRWLLLGLWRLFSDALLIHAIILYCAKYFSHWRCRAKFIWLWFSSLIAFS